ETDDDPGARRLDSTGIEYCPGCDRLFERRRLASIAGRVSDRSALDIHAWPQSEGDRGVDRICTHRRADRLLDCPDAHAVAQILPGYPSQGGVGNDPSAGSCGRRILECVVG